MTSLTVFFIFVFIFKIIAIFVLHVFCRCATCRLCRRLQLSLFHISSGPHLLLFFS